MTTWLLWVTSLLSSCTFSNFGKTQCLVSVKNSVKNPGPLKNMVR